VRSTLASYWQRPAPGAATTVGPAGAAQGLAAGHLPGAVRWLAAAVVPVATIVLLIAGGATI
jgi:hypothetical protein